MTQASHCIERIHHHHKLATMVARAMVLEAVEAEITDADENDRLTFQKFAEAIVDALEEQEKRLVEKLQKTGKFSEESKKDRKRSEPKEVFTGSNHIDFEWRLVNHMQTCFGEEGRRLMRWIKEKAQGDKKIANEEGKGEFADWQEMDRELWTQVMRSEGEEVTSIIQSATQDGVVGAEAWRALKHRYDPETAITLEA